jgi:hypothetical protein
MKVLLNRAGDYTKLKNSVTKLRREARTFSATKAAHDREMDTLKKALLFAKNGVISDYSSTTIQRTHGVLVTSLVDATRRSDTFKKLLARNVVPDVRRIWEPPETWDTLRMRGSYLICRRWARART